MANEIGPITHTSAETLYALIFLADGTADNGKVRDVVTGAWDALAEADWDDYDVSVDEVDTSGVYQGDLPTGLSLNRAYSIVVYSLAGTTPDPDADTVVATGTIGPPVGAGPLEQEVVPDARTFMLRATRIGLVGEKPVYLQVDDNKLLAWDFRTDLPTGGRVSTVSSVALQVASSGLTLTAVGVDHSQAKVRVQADTAGEYTVRCVVIYDNNDQAEGDGKIIVKANA
jgi:hypothetical protein